MGFLDSLVGALTGKNKCPRCGTPGGPSPLSGSYRCYNPLCPNFDPSLLGGVASVPSPSRPPAPPVMSPLPAETLALPAATSPGAPDPAPRATLAGTIDIDYLNHAGEQKRFTADIASLNRVKEHIHARVRPKGLIITLARARIQNLAAVEAVMPTRVAPGQAWPTPRERQVLNYHAKHKTTSPLHATIRAKYPNW